MRAVFDGCVVSWMKFCSFPSSADSCAIGSLTAALGGHEAARSHAGGGSAGHLGGGEHCWR